MEFRETLLAAQRNQKQKSSENVYYKAKFDPPKKEQKQKDKLSANIQKFLAKKEEEERQKKLDEKKKVADLQASRDPKAQRKILKTLKTIKSANKSVLADAVDTEHTAITREGAEQPDQDDYGYESQEAAAIYQKMMEKYSKIPDEPKFPSSSGKSKKDLEGTKERVKQALLHEDEPVPHKRRRRTGGNPDGPVQSEREPSPAKPEVEKKPDKPKPRRPAPPPMDFNQLLKLAEQKKHEAVEPEKKVPITKEGEPERLMTKKQRREHEEEMARRRRRQERLDAERGGGSGQREERPREPDRERKPETSGFGRIPKIGEKSDNGRIPKIVEKSDSGRIAKISDNGRIQRLSEKSDKPVGTDSPKSSTSKIDKEIANERERIEKLQRERDRIHKEKADRDQERSDRERLEKLKAEREKIERDIERLNKDRDRLEKTKQKLDAISRVSDKSVDRSKIREQDKKNIDLKSQNTYRIDKSSNERKVLPSKSGMNGHISQGKAMPRDRASTNGMRPENGKRPEPSQQKARPDDRKPQAAKQDVKQEPGRVAPSFDFDKHVNSLKNGPSSGNKPNGARPFPPGDVKRKMHPDDRRKMHPDDRRKMHPDDRRKMHPDDRQKLMAKRRVMDSESERDSEMDDFIDDADENIDYSTHIKDIFGYDKSRYRDIDDDDDPEMESSFSRVMREEYVSKKIGIMEDLEDMKMEKEMMKKKKRRVIDDD